MTTLRVRGNARAFLDDIFPDMLACTSDDDPDADELRTLARCYSRGVLTVDPADAETLWRALGNLADSEDAEAERLVGHNADPEMKRIHRSTSEGFRGPAFAALKLSPRYAPVAPPRAPSDSPDAR